MIDYIMKVKGTIDNLATIRELVLEQDQIMNLLGGLRSDYNAVVTAINIRDDKIFIEAVYSMLLAFEHRLEQQSSIDLVSISACYASSSNNRGGGRKYNGSRGQSHASNTSNYTYRGRSRGGRDDWYFDSGASHHLTQNEGNLNNSAPYTGTDRVTIGNDNNALIEFRSNSFIMKDLHTKKVLVQGRLENALYKFPVLHRNKKLVYVGVHNTSTFHSHRLSPVYNKVELWHHRLGHVATDIVVQVM
ncbi:hypothetical protein POTOM_004970 [Populus tomentosa]|uniref:GAG-pre-integrase domain-containing protein n=1 Tax=Populus tomentosa TaxID=118781 RepID=A0A8X8AL42_POPTO|nr:hypothetical protein POTOM_004970 [Populus tomentosa]